MPGLETLQDMYWEEVGKKTGKEKSTLRAFASRAKNEIDNLLYFINDQKIWVFLKENLSMKTRKHHTQK